MHSFFYFILEKNWKIAQRGFSAVEDVLTVPQTVFGKSLVEGPLGAEHRHSHNLSAVATEELLGLDLDFALGV